MLGGLPFIGISTFIYGLVGLTVLARGGIRSRIRRGGPAGDLKDNGGAAQ